MESCFSWWLKAILITTRIANLIYMGGGRLGYLNWSALLNFVVGFCFFMVPNQILLQKFLVWYIWSGVWGSTFLLDIACSGPKRKYFAKIVRLIYLDWRGVQPSCWILPVLVPNEKMLRKLWVWYIWTGGGFWMDHQDTYWPSIDGTHLPTSRPNGNNCITKYSYNQVSFTLCVLKKGVQQAWINLPEELYLCQFFRVQSVCRKYESTAQKTLSEEENNCCNTCTHCKGKV